MVDIETLKQIPHKIWLKQLKKFYTVVLPSDL